MSVKHYLKQNSIPYFYYTPISSIGNLYTTGNTLAGSAITSAASPYTTYASIPTTTIPLVNVSSDNIQGSASTGDLSNNIFRAPISGSYRIEYSFVMSINIQLINNNNNTNQAAFSINTPSSIYIDMSVNRTGSNQTISLFKSPFSSTAFVVNNNSSAGVITVNASGDLFQSSGASLVYLNKTDNISFFITSFNNTAITTTTSKTSTGTVTTYYTVNLGIDPSSSYIRIELLQ